MFTTLVVLILITSNEYNQSILSSLHKEQSTPYRA